MPNENMTPEDFPLVDRSPLLGATLDQTADINPESHAKDLQLSRDVGRPLDAVKFDPAAAERESRMKEIDKYGVNDYPVLHSVMSNIDTNPIVKNDVENMAGLERILTPIAQGAQAGLYTEESFLRLPAFAEDLVKQTAQTVESFTGLPKMFDPIRGLQTIASGYRMIFDPVANQFQRARQELPKISDAFKRVDYVNQKGEEAFNDALHGKFGKFLDVVSDPEAMSTYFASAVPSLFVAMATGGSLPAVASMEGGNELVNQADYQQEHGPIPLDRKVTATMQTALINGMLEKFGIDYLRRFPMFQKFFKEADKRGINISDAFKAAGVESGTEAMQQFNQNMAELLAYDQNQKLQSGILQSFLGGGLAGGAAGGAGYVQDRAYRKAEAAAFDGKKDVNETDQQKIDKVNWFASKSNSRKLDPGTFRQFVHDINNDQNVYLDGEATREFMKGKSAEEIKTDPALKTIQSAMDNSEPGTDISVKMHDFATDIAGTPTYDALREHMKLDPESSTPANQAQAKSELEGYTSRLMEEAKQNASAYVESQDIFTKVRDQLIDTGRMTSQQASIAAQIVPAWAVVQSESRGIPVAQVYEESGLKIEGPFTGAAEEIAAEKKRSFTSRLMQRGKDLIFGVKQSYTEPTGGTNLDFTQQTTQQLGGAEQVLHRTVAGQPAAEGWAAATRAVREGRPFIFYRGGPDTLREEHFKPENLGFTSGNPSSGLGIFFTTHQAEAQAYGNVEQFHLDMRNPKVIKADELPHFDSAAEATAYREALRKEGYDGIVIHANHLGKKEVHFVAFDPHQVIQTQQTFAQAPVTEQTDTPAFKKWAGTDKPVIDPYEINDTDFSGPGPYVMRAFHGTTHTFEEFNAALKGNLEGQFGAVNYFTSDEGDADANYAGEGPDLTNRIEQRAERIADELSDVPEEEIVNLASQYGIKFDPEKETYPEELPRAMASQELHGGGGHVMEVFIRTDNPFVAGTEDSPWIEFIDWGELEDRAIDRVSEDEDIPVEEIKANQDEYQNQIDEARWDIENEEPNKLIEAVQTVADKYDFDPSELFSELYDYATDSVHQATLEEVLRKSESLTYIEKPDTGELAQSQAISDIIQELGFDSIILKNADKRFSNMSMGSGTAHIHVFDANNTNIKSVENVGTFDITNPNIYQQESRGYYDPQNSLIRLTEASDLSTFLHEFAHFMYDMERRNPQSRFIGKINQWFKRNAEDVALEANGYDGGRRALERGRVIKREGPIVADDVIGYIDNGTSGDIAKDDQIARAVHEQFARGFEQYLMEGKAPSIELHNVFRSFARWLVQVYKSIRGDMQVNLDKEMRQVFDRLLATDDQIAAAENRARFEPMFSDAAMAGMTEEEFTKYKIARENTIDKAEETLREKLIKQLTRQTERWWKEERADIAAQEEERLKDERVYRAIDQLRNGDIKLDTAAVKEKYSGQRTDKLGRTMTHVNSKLSGMVASGGEGMAPDTAAAMLGYDSGDQMIQEIINTKSIKQQARDNAQQMMLDKHGDIMTDGTIQKEADEALQNEERGKIILMELKALAKGTKRGATDREMLKSLAEDAIGRLNFRQIQPGKYRAAELKAAQEAAAMLAKGNKEGAVAAKTKQAMNYYLGMAATAAKNDTMKIVDRMVRYRKKNVQQAIQKAGNGYWEQLVKILSRFEFRKVATLREVDKTNESITSWMKTRIEEDGDGLVIAPAVLDEGYIKHWKNVPYSELVGIGDSVKNIEHVARYGNKIKAAQEEMEFQQFVQKWTDSIRAKVTDRYPTVASVADKPNKATKWARWAMAQMTKIPYLASWLDGGERAGLSHDVLVQPFTDAYDEENTLWHDIGTPVLSLIKDRSQDDIKRHNTKVFIPEIQGTNGHTGNLMGHEIIAIALNTGNMGNLKKLLLGEGWANPDNEAEISFDNPRLQAVLKHMTRNDWIMVQQIWDQMEKLYPMLAEVHRRTTGLTPPKVQATPITTEYGKFRGGYYPVKYDPARSHRAQLNEDKLNAETESMFGTMGIQASVNASATNERTGYYAPIRLSLDVVPNHFQETIHYITHHDAVRQVNKLIRNATVASAIKETLGPDEFAQLKPWLNDIAKDGRNAPTKNFIESVLQRLRFGSTLVIMGFKVSTGLMQLLGINNTIAEVGLAPTLQAVRSILGSPQTMRDSWGFAAENSRVMNHRVNTMDREIRNAMMHIEGNRGFKAAAQEASMKHIALIQTYLVDLPSWHAAYIKGMKEWGDETRAYKYADWVVENIQGSGITKDMAQIMRNQSQAVRMLTMFMTFFSSLWNMERDTARGAKSGMYSKTTVAAKIMFMFAIPAFLEMLLRGQFGGDDKDPEAQLQDYLTNVALQPVQSIPFVRDVAQGLFTDYGYNVSPIASFIEKGLKGSKNIASAPFTDHQISQYDVKGATELGAAIFGIPGTAQAWATGEHLYDVLNKGEDLTVKQLMYGPERKKK